MKLWNKRTLLIAFCTALVGTAMALGAWFSGAEIAVKVDKTGVRIVGHEREESHVEEQNLPSFTSVKVEANNANIHVKQGETYGLDIRYYDNDLMDPPLEYQVENGKLIITQPSQNTNTFSSEFSLNFYNINIQKTPKITIVIPENASLLDLDISNNYGAINISDLSAQQMMLFAYSGKINLQDVSTDSMAVKNYYGDTIIENKTVQKIDDLELYAQSGKIKLLQLDVGTLDITNSYGSINLDEVASENLLIDAESANITADNVTFENVDISNSYGSVQANTWFSSQLFMDVESGDIDIVGTLHGETQIKNNYGDTCLTLNDRQEDYQMELYSDKIQIGDTTIEKRYHSDTPNAQHSLEIDSDNSRVTLKFLE